MKDDSGPLVQAYAAIEGLVGEVDIYVKVGGGVVLGGGATKAMYNESLKLKVLDYGYTCSHFGS